MTIPGCITTGSTAVGHQNGERYGVEGAGGAMARVPVLEAADPGIARSARCDR
jgi:hypothetical protein